PPRAPGDPDHRSRCPARVLRLAGDRSAARPRRPGRRPQRHRRFPARLGMDLPPGGRAPAARPPDELRAHHHAMNLTLTLLIDAPNLTCPALECGTGAPVALQLKTESKTKSRDGSGWLVGVITAAARYCNEKWAYTF